MADAAHTFVAKPPKKHVRKTSMDALLRYAELLGYGDLHFKIDKKTGLHAIVAIHNLKLGPAIGGCRLVTYPSVDKAIVDAMRLGYMMSYKSAINNLPHGGAKAVLLKPAVIKNREAYFQQFAEFLNELGGRYITAVDSGTNATDMDIIAKYTPYVTCTSAAEDHDPSAFTALGVRRGIEAAVKFKLGKDSLAGVHVAVQGVGHVGQHLIKELLALGASITACDTNTDTLQRCVREYGIAICQPHDIYQLEADVFAPCALGAILNLHTIKQLKVKIIAGAANNQLAHQRYGKVLFERGILYAPDFLINAGGIIHVAVIYGKGNVQEAITQINDIYQTTYDIFEGSAREHCPTNLIAERIAAARLQ